MIATKYQPEEWYKNLNKTFIYGRMEEKRREFYNIRQSQSGFLLTGI